MLASAAPASAGFLTPESPSSPNASDMNTTWIVMLALAVLIGSAVTVALVLAVRRSSDVADVPPRTRAAPGAHKKVVGALTAFALALFVFGVVMNESTLDVEPTGPNGLATQTAQRDIDLPAEAGEVLNIKVAGQRWLWRYEYPDETFSYYELVVPVDTAVVLDIDSTDVLHRWWVPGLTGQFDAIPGSTNRTWFKAEETGLYEGRSTAFSGAAFATMETVVRVVEADEYEAFLQEQADRIDSAQDAVQEAIDSGQAPTIEGGS